VVASDLKRETAEAVAAAWVSGRVLTVSGGGVQELD